VKRELFKLIAGQICLHACMTGMRMATPLLALRSGQSAASVGFLLALFALTQVFLALPAGRFVDRHGLKKPLALSIVLACLGAGAAAVWPIYSVLCFSALMCGGATGSAIIALQRHVGRAAQDKAQMKQAFSWLAIGPAFSNFIGPFFAGLMIDAAGFEWAFAMLAVFPVLTWLWVRHIQDLPPIETPADTTQSRAWALLKEPTFRRLIMVNWFLSACWDAHTFVVPILGHERGLSASVIGSILGGFAISAALVRLMLPLIISRVHEWQVILTAMIMTSFFLALYPLAHEAWTMGLCSLAMGLFLGSVQPMIMSLLHQVTPEHRHGEAIGLRLMGINASSVIMPMIFGAVGATLGAAGVFWCVSAFVGLGSRTAWQLRSYKNPE
jgi:MFS family permease